MNTPRRVIILGMKHSGKSTVGKLCAKELSIPFFDLDDLVIEAAGVRPREFVQTRGVAAFRDLEAKTLHKFLEAQGDSNEWILATGGGVVESPRAMQELRDARKHGELVVALNGGAERLYKRVVKKGIPAILDPQAPYRSYLHLFHGRAPRYRQAAVRCIELAGLESQDAAAKLITIIGEYFDVGK